MCHDIVLVTFSPNHSSVRYRVEDCNKEKISVYVYQGLAEKLETTLFRRVVSIEILRLLKFLLKKKPKILWAWGLDACIVGSLYKILRPSTKLVWDISDISSYVAGTGVISVIFRQIERYLIKFADSLVLSSPAFYEFYYGKIAEEKKVTIVENLLLGSPSVTHRINKLPIVIVYPGIFRSEFLLELIGDVAASLRGFVEFRLHGYPDRLVGSTVIDRLVKNNTNVLYYGKYKEEELFEIYKDAHFTWAFVDLKHNSLNEQILLSNRVYQAVAYSCPALTTVGTYTADYVVQNKIGISCIASPQEIVSTLENAVENDWRVYNDLVAIMPDPCTAFLSGEYAQVILRIKKHGGLDKTKWNNS